MAATINKNSSYEDCSHFSNVMKQLNKQRLTNSFCDVVLKVGENQVFAHSNVLAASSLYFYSFLGQGEDNPRAFSQSTPQVIEIHIEGSGGDVGFGEAVGKVVEYMYTGKLEITDNILNQLIEIAKIMQMDKIISFCNLYRAVIAKTDKEPDPNQTNNNPTILGKRKRGRPRRITTVLVVGNGDEEKHSKNEDVEVKREYDDFDIGNAEDLSDTEGVAETRSGRKSKLTSKMKELKSRMQAKSSNEKDTSDFADEKDPEINVYQCENCPFHTSLKHNYKKHIQTHLNASERSEKYFCDICEFKTSRARQFNEHKIEHLHEKQQCGYCNYKGESEEDFKAHLQKHMHPLPFFCEYCDQRFRTKTMLNFHYPKHSELKPFVCKICNFGFKWKHALKSHMVTHSDTKEHLCDICGFATAHKSQLKAHNLIHTGETFKCTECNFEATKRQNLKYHMLTHTHEKPHQCEVCGQSFSLNKNMKRHMLLHTEDRPYKCDQCTYTTTRYDKLKEHLLKQHGQGEIPKKRHRLWDYPKSLVKEDYKQIQQNLAEKRAMQEETIVQEVSESDILSTLQTIQYQVQGQVNHINEAEVPTQVQSATYPALLFTKKQDDGTAITYQLIPVDQNT